MNVSFCENHNASHTRSRCLFFHDARWSSLHMHTCGFLLFACMSHGANARLMCIIGWSESGRNNLIACINQDSGGPGVEAINVVTCVLRPTGSTHCNNSESLTNADSSTICRSATYPRLFCVSGKECVFVSDERVQDQSLPFPGRRRRHRKIDHGRGFYFK